MNQDVTLLKSQWDFLSSHEKYVLYLGGIGSGKTVGGAHFALKKCHEEPQAKGFIGANTYRQLTRSTLGGLFSILTDLGIPFAHNQSKGILKIGNTEILCGTMENFDVHRGIEIGWFWLDECRDMKLEAVKVMIGRLRDKNAKRLEGRFTSSAKGFNWMYDMFIGPDKLPNTKCITSKTADNTFLPDDYELSLRDSYDSKMAAQELDAEILNIGSGRVYYAFSRAKNVKPVVQDPLLPIYIGMDFNVDPMTCVFANVTETSIRVFDEYYMRNSNTYEIAKSIKEKYGTQNIRIVPDATGKALRTSSAGLSDHQILKNEFGNVILGSTNPFRMDRYNAVNKLLEDGRLIVDPKCRYTIKDLEQLSFKEGSNMPDTGNPLLGHISDGLGYMVFRTHGLGRSRPSRTLQL